MLLLRRPTVHKALGNTKTAIYSGISTLPKEMVWCKTNPCMTSFYRLIAQLGFMTCVILYA